MHKIVYTVSVHRIIYNKKINKKLSKINSFSCKFPGKIKHKKPALTRVIENKKAKLEECLKYKWLKF